MNKPKFKVGDQVYCLVINDEHDPVMYGILKTKIHTVRDMSDAGDYIPFSEQHYWLDDVDEHGDLMEVAESQLSFSKQELINHVIRFLSV